MKSLLVKQELKIPNYSHNNLIVSYTVIEIYLVIFRKTSLMLRMIQKG